MRTAYGHHLMTQTRPVIHVRARSAIADAELARSARTDLPGLRRPSLRAGGPRALIAALRSLGRPVEPERVIVMPLATAPAPIRRR